MDMFDSQTQIFVLDGVGTFANFAANWLVQSTLLVAAGLVAGRLLHARGAAAQSLVYRTTLVAVLVCPLATMTLWTAGFSGWSVQLPNTWAMQAGGAGSNEGLEITSSQWSTDLRNEFSKGAAAPSDRSIEMEESARDFLNDADKSSFNVVAAPEQAFKAGSPETVVISTEAPSPELTETIPAATEPTAAKHIAIERIGIAVCLAGALWCLVGFALVFRLLSAWIKLWKLKRSAVEVEPELRLVCEKLSVRMNVASPRVFRSPFLPSPCLAGLRDPWILLPEEECSLSIQDVLVHELAHLRRNDCHWNLLRQVATAIFFFQPLLWVLSRRLEIAAEEVCDDFVVEFGGNRSEYAHRLVDIAELSTASIAAAGVGVVSFRSMVEQRVSRIMDTSRALSTGASKMILVTVLGCGLLGTTMTGLLGLSPSRPVVAVLLQSEEGSSDTKELDGGGKRFTGQVVDGAGDPIAGATVTAVRSRGVPYQYNVYEYEQVATIQTDALGQFEMEIPPAEKLPSNLPGDYGQWMPANFIATAPGYALNWAKGDKGNEGGKGDSNDQPISLRLDKALPPILGKLLKPDGTPAVGIEVQVKQLTSSISDEVKRWLEDGTMKSPPKKPYSYGKSFSSLSNQHPAFPAKVITDAQGQFELDGISDQHMATLFFSGQEMMRESIMVVNHAMREFQIGDQSYVGSKFEYTLTQGVTVEGKVSCADTGQPLAGVGIAITTPSGANSYMVDKGRAKTDSKGHFQVDGLPPVVGVKLQLEPASDQPYLATRQLDIPGYGEPRPAKMELKLRRGVFIRGRLTDADTGKPVAGKVIFSPLKSNPHAANYQRYSDGTNWRLSPSQGTPTNEDGEFQIVGIPGRGILSAVGNRPQDWCTSFGVEKIEAGKNTYAFDTYDQCGFSECNAMAEVDIPEDGSETSTDIQLSRGGTIRFRPVDPDGNPLVGVNAQHGFSIFSGAEVEQKDGLLEIAGMHKGEQRKVILIQRELGLGRFVTVAAPAKDNRDPSVQDVTLKPCAVVSGRLVDKDGKPMVGKHLSAFGGATSNWTSQIERATTADDGSFRFEHLVPDGTYRISQSSAGLQSSAGFGRNELANELELGAGETVDLGTITESTKKRRNGAILIKAVEAVDVRKTSVATPASRNTISGVVIGPDGERVPGAKFYWLAYRSYELQSSSAKLIATSNAKGEFKFEKPSLNLAPDAPASWKYYQHIVVRAPGYGFSMERPGILLRQSREGETIVGNLATAIDGVKGAVVELPAAGNPLRGRVVDIEGSGVANAKVQIRWFKDEDAGANFDHGQGQGQLSKFADCDEKQWTAYINKLINIADPPPLVDVFPMAATDADGRFEIADVGADRLFQILIHGERIEFARIIARNQPGEKVTVTSDSFSAGNTFVVHPQEILHVAGPSVPVEGRVLDFDTSKPIANAMVLANRVHGSNTTVSRERKHFRSRTDKDGNYRIMGLPLGEENRLVSFCSESELPYPKIGFKADTSKPDDVLKHDFRMKRGVWAEGRVFDADTNKPMVGSVEYCFFGNDKLLKDVPGCRYSFVHNAYWTNRDGYFRVPVWPTRGILAYNHDPVSHEEGMNPTIDRYPRGYGADSIKGSDKNIRLFRTFPHFLMAEDSNRLIQINPDGKQDSINAAMPMFASRKVFAKPVWPEGAFVEKYQVYGAARNWGWQEIDTPEFEIKGLEDDEQRKVFVFHRKRNLVGVLKVSTADQPDATQDAPAEITVQQAGTITGRLLDADGLPVTDATLGGNYGNREDMAFGVWAPHPGKIWNPSSIPTDKDGRFQLTGIVPGMKYTASATAKRNLYSDRMVSTNIGTAFSNVMLKPGEKKDLGDLKLRVGEEKKKPAAKVESKSTADSAGAAK